MAFEILGSTKDEIEDIKRLESCFSEIPPTNRISDPCQGRQWLKEWLTCELFENLPCDGLVVKINSGEVKGKLGVNSKIPNWALTLK